MSTIERSALVPYSADQMYAVVVDVEAYPEFLPWCSKARIVEQTGDVQLAELELSRGAMRQRFSTRNHLERPTSIRLELLEGPLAALAGEWRFRPLADAGCKVELTLTFELDSRVMNVAFGQLWKMTADRMVDAFCARAESVYG